MRRVPSKLGVLRVLRSAIPVLFLGVASVGTTYAQVGLTMASGAGAPGSAVVLNLTLADNSAAPASIQWAMSYSTTDFSSMSVVVGAQGTAASKSLTCNNTAGNSSCVLWGLNNNTISSGVIATVTLTISPSTLSTASSVSLLSSTASSAAGSTITSSNSSGVVTINQVSSTLSSVSCAPSTVIGGISSICTVTLTSVATSG